MPQRFTAARTGAFYMCHEARFVDLSFLRRVRDWRVHRDGIGQIEEDMRATSRSRER